MQNMTPQAYPLYLVSASETSVSEQLVIGWTFDLVQPNGSALPVTAWLRDAIPGESAFSPAGDPANDLMAAQRDGDKVWLFTGLDEMRRFSAAKLAELEGRQ